MPSNLRQLRPTELVQLLNSTPLGAVLSERQLRQHRMRGGLRLGDSQRVDLFKYVAWLVGQVDAKAATPDEYVEVKERARGRAARISLAGRDIGEIPPVADPERRAEGEASFRSYCEIYFPDVFYLPWSDDHERVIATMEEVGTRGGLFGIAMPRGSGKTSLCEALSLWTPSRDLRRFILLIGAEDSHAIELLESIKTEIECNELLLADFPEIMYPFRKLEGIASRCKGQLYDGQRTHIGWGLRQIVFPTIKNAGGAVLRVAGLMARLRGMKHTRPDGRAVRPDLVVIEDPQTDASAASPSQSANRERLLAGAILNLGGPGEKIAAVMPVTVIQPGDMADNILNRKLHPEWNGERLKMVYKFPTNEKLWARYTEILRDPSGKSYHDNLADATAFYAGHREQMDAGAVVAWDARFEEGEISALQHAMNLKIRDEGTFYAEFQNEPKIGDEEGDLCTAEQIAAKLNGHPAGHVPAERNIISMYADVHDKLLYYAVGAFDKEFSGSIIDYGTYPDQRRRYFSMREARITLARKKPGAGREGAIFAGLRALTDDFLGRTWPSTEAGTVHRIGVCLIDEGYKYKTVRAAIQSSPYRAALMPSKGMSIRAAHKPFAEYIRHKGDRNGHCWRTPAPANRRQIRGMQIDTNYWKSHVHTAFATAQGDKGSCDLWGQSEGRHQMFAEHLAESEYFTTTEGRGRTVHEWSERPNHPENHLLDCTVGVFVGASYQGAALPGTEAPKPKRRKRRTRYS